MAGGVSFQLTEEDCVAAYRDHLRDRFSGSGPVGIVQYVSAISLLLIAIAWVASLAMPRLFGDWASKDSLVPWVIAFLASFWALRAIVFLGSARSTRRLFRQRASFQEPLTYGWSDEGLSFRTSHSNGRIPWADLHSWRPGKHSFRFYTDERMFFFIPRSALNDAEAQDLDATVAASGATGPPRLEDGLIYP